MPHYTYLLVGGGMTADAAVGGIRQVDAEGTIAMIGAESYPPYNRPPLSKALWKGEPLDTIWRQTDARGITLHRGRQARTLDPRAKQVTDDQGNVYTYEKLLLATGGTPRRLPFGDDQIIYYRSLDDYKRLRTWTEQRRRFAVVGGGFIGSEIAAALALNGKSVTMLFPEEGIGARIFPQDLARVLNGFYHDREVEVLPGEQVVGFNDQETHVALRTQSGRDVIVDGIVAGIGIQPNTELARGAGLAVDNGIPVDEFLRTSHPAIFAAGDVASFHNPALGTRIRVEHEDNANVMGRAAGQAMAGEAAPYDHLPFFYSDLFDMGYEAVGDLDPNLEIVADWKEQYREGVIYYLRNDRVRGVLLWNTWGQVDAARALIAEPGPFRPADLKGRLPAS